MPALLARRSIPSVGSEPIERKQIIGVWGRDSSHMPEEEEEGRWAREEEEERKEGRKRNGWEP